MNTYDPADGICYVHLASYSSPEMGTTCHTLPVGYPNGSPRTRLGHRRAPLRRPVPLSDPGQKGTSDLLPADFRPVPA